MLIERRKDYFVCKVGREPIAELGVGKGVAGIVAERDEKESIFVVGGLQRCGDFAVERTPQGHHYRAALGKQNLQHGTFDGRMKSADDNLVGLGDFVCPSVGEGKGLGWRITRCEECHQLPVEQVLISG